MLGRIFNGGTDHEISAATGLAPQKAEQALGIMLNLIKTQGNQNKVAELFAKLPGAAALVARHGGDGASSGGLLGMLAGGMMGGPLAAVTKLSAAGLSMDQIKAAGDHHAGLCQGQGGR